MAIYSKLSNVRKLTNSSLNAIIDVSNLNFTDISAAMLEFLNDISYDEDTNSINNLYDINTNYLTVSNEFTVTLNGVPTWTIDSQGRAEGNSFLVEVAESKRDRHTNFPNWPDVGVPGEIIYTGIQLQKPPFGEDFIGYLDDRGWVSLTQGGNVTSNVLTLETYDIGSPPLGPPAVPGSGLVWVGPPGMGTGDPVTTQDLYFTDENSAVFTLLTVGDLLWEEGSALIDKLGTYSVVGTTDFSIIGGGNQHQMVNTTYSAIIGGLDNKVQLAGGALNIFNAVVGGNSNIISGDAFNSFIGGGSSNSLGDSIVGIDNVAIIGGSSNQIIKSSNSAIIGGTLNNVDTASRSVILGGTGVSATSDDTVYIPNLTINEQYTFPNVDGSANYVLVTDGLGTVTWQAQTGGGGANFAFTTVRNFVASVPLTITHSLDTEDIQVQLIDTISDELIEGEISTYTGNTVDVTLTATKSNIKIVILSAGGVSPSGDSCWTCVGSPGFDIQMKVPGAVLPWGDDFNDLGEPTLRWKDIYLGSTIDFLTTLDIDNDGTTIIKVSEYGAEFESDFSGTYNNRSIVDKEYVDNAIVDRGLTYLILAGDITDVEAVTKINQDTGENTQFIWIQTTDALTTATIPDVQDAVEVIVTNNETLLTVDVPDLEKNWISGIIGSNPVLTSLSFPLLDKMAGPFEISNNPLLTSMDFGSLIEANSISITSNSSLNSATVDFDNLVDVSGSLSLRNNNITAWNFPELLTVGAPYATSGWISIGQEDNVTDITFPKLVSNHGYFLVFENPLLTTLSQPELVEIGGNCCSISGNIGLHVDSCDSLVNLNFPKLEKIYWGNIWINDNILLQNLSLPLLEEIYMTIQINNNPLLTAIEFPSFTISSSAQGGLFQSFDNAVLTKIECNSIVNMNKGMDFNTNPLLSDINFPLLETQIDEVNKIGPYLDSLITLEFPELNICDQMEILICNNLKNINFPKLTTMYNGSGSFYRTLRIMACPSLEDVNFPLLQTIGQLNIENNNFPSSSPASSLDFTSLQYADSQIRIVNNPGLDSIYLGALEDVDNNIFIMNNSDLTSLNFSSLVSIGNPAYFGANITITDNPLLEDLEFPSLVSMESNGPSQRYFSFQNNNLSTTTLDNLFLYFAALSPHITDLICSVQGNQGVSSNSDQARAALALSGWTIQT